MRPALLVVYLKELRDSLRDRRTALMVFIASILTGPVTLILVAQYVTGLEEKASILKVRIAGQQHAPALVNFLQRSDVLIETAPADYENLIREGRLDAVIVVPKEFDQRFLTGEAARVEIVYDDSRAESSPATRQAERLLRAFNRETGMLRLVSRGVSPEIIEPVKVQHVNTATPRQKGAFLLFLIPMFAILSPLLGGMAVAIDSTAGERERGSLEPLLANPVPLWQVVVGKWLAAWTFAAGVATLTLGAFRSAHHPFRRHDRRTPDAHLHLWPLLPRGADLRELSHDPRDLRAAVGALRGDEGRALAAPGARARPAGGVLAHRPR